MKKTNVPIKCYRTTIEQLILSNKPSLSEHFQLKDIITFY